jgi:hypothetical protein
MSEPPPAAAAAAAAASNVDEQVERPLVPELELVELERDSPIVKHYSSTKNSRFVTCVNSALCS